MVEERVKMGVCFRERGSVDGFDNKSEGKELDNLLDLWPEKWAAGPEREKENDDFVWRKREWGVKILYRMS